MSLESIRRSALRFTARLRARVDGRGSGEGGFILLESIIAISLITVIMGAVGAEYVSSLAISNQQRLRATAVQIAETQMEKMRALQPSDLTTGRGSSAVSTEYSTLAAISNVAPSLNAGTAYRSFDSSATASTTGTNIPTTSTPLTVGTTTYNVWQYLECAGAANTGSCVSTSSGTNNLRAVVAVTWPGRGCPSNRCAYTTSALINSDADPTFDLNQPLPAAPVVNNPAALTVASGDTVSYQMTVQNNTGVTPFNWTVTSGSLPNGLSMSAAGLISGTVSGAAASPSTTITVMDAYLRTASLTVAWTVEAALSITPVNDQVNFTTDTVSLTVSATGGGGTGYTFADPTSSLPAGLSISSAGRITGKPVGPRPGPKTYPVSLTVTDPQSCVVCVTAPRTASTAFNWTVNYPPLAASQPSTQTATVSTTLTATKTVMMSATGGDGSYTWSATGLPTGLTINATSGLISGTPTALGTFSVTVTVADSTAGVTPAATTFTWKIVAKPSLAPLGTQNATIGTAVNLATSPTCPDTPCTYSGGNLPTGLTVNSGGTITGTLGGSAATYSNVTVTVTDSAGASSTTSGFTWTVYATPTVAGPVSHAVTETAADSTPISYTCPYGPCTITLTGTVPGLGLSTTATATGNNTTTTLNVPTSASTATVYVAGTIQANAVTGAATSATYNPVVRITSADSVSASTSAAVVWTAYAPPTVTSPGSLSSASYAVLNLPVASSCPNAPCTYALLNGPAGLGMTSGGVIVGTITSAAQTFSMATVAVTDADGVTVTTAFSWVVTTTNNNLAAYFGNVAVTADTYTSPGNFDGANNMSTGDSFSATALSNAGITAGGTVVSNGVSFTWPVTAGTGQSDNVLAAGQTVTLRGNGSTLGFLVSSAYGSSSGSGTITYTDGTTQTFTLASADWWGSATSASVATMSYYNAPNNVKQTQNVNVYYAGVALNAAKTVASVKLPNISSKVAPNVTSMHVFAMSLTASTLTTSANNVGVTADTARTAGNLDGAGDSLSKTALANAGATSGGTVTTSGTAFTWPTAAGTGTADNTTASGQTIDFSGSGTSLGFLLTSINAATSGTATIFYTDGTQQTFTLASPLVSTNTSTAAIATTYINTQQSSSVNYTANIFYTSVALAAGKSIDAVQLPNISTGATSGTNAMHVFAMSVK